MSTLFYVSYAALWLLLLTMGVLVLLLYRHFGVMSLGSLEGVQRDGLPIGSLAPPISGVTAAGQDTRWEPTRGQPQLLLFAAPDCEPCATVLPHVERLARVVNGGLGRSCRSFWRMPSSRWPHARLRLRTCISKLPPLASPPR